MKEFYIYIILVTLISLCAARVTSRNKSSSGSVSDPIIAAIVLSSVFGFVIIVILIIYCKNKFNKRMGVLPMQSNAPVYGQENLYAPPSYKLPPYDQPSAYPQPPPYGQPSAYSQPPPYPSPFYQENQQKL
ncbi:unnamed protein product [Rotaria magnacalcarata]|uniref:Uncharacterized protein n=2 Tax=Rotaria magnacalcarata TaxID=392030 RepID=A0A816S956_9BILA|nr:unnamed protein product [Rotaria magnacalcarata]CAF2085287.1 unnamed protein product [Rotaria magnacalcarata]CAF4009806.1 unnamed protein product [Rotaria magnacalcarata]